MVRLRDLTEWERMVADYGLLGLSPSYHPLGLLRPRLSKEIRTASALREIRDGARVKTAGLAVCRQRPGTAKGFVFLLLEDETGLTNLVVGPAVYERARIVVRTELYLYVEAIVQLRSGSLNLIVTQIEPLAQRIGPIGPGTALDPATPLPEPVEVASNLPDPAGDPAIPAPLEALRLATPAGHNFH